MNEVRKKAEQQKENYVPAFTCKKCGTHESTLEAKKPYTILTCNNCGEKYRVIWDINA